MSKLTEKLEQWKAEQRAKGADSFQSERIEGQGPKSDIYKVYAFNGGRLLDTLEIRNFKV